MSDQAKVPASAVGYVFRTEPADKAWAYIGQGTRLDPKRVDGYFGSGAFMTEMLAEHGTSGLTETIVATAESHDCCEAVDRMVSAKRRVHAAQALGRRPTRRD